MHKDVKFRKICAKCGISEAEDINFIEGICEKCFLEKNSIISLFKQAKIIVCMKCKPQTDFEIVKTKIELLPKIKPNHISINITARKGNSKIVQDFEFPLEVEYRNCPLCARAGSDYFEAILQIRPKNKAVKNFVDAEIKILDYKITREDELKEGYDLYFVRKRDAFNLIRKLKEEFEGEVKNSRTLHGKDRNGKLSYRSTFLFRVKE